ncbi:hypothetical protein CFC21_014315 [Triticum aestivum]|uniref:C2H2-type domain-containing protein n=3 Tax=Triticum TaxID=4564 RepID=A0A9R1DUL3_WHEAT|nr:zinc finger protein ZAT5-like [Triticum dicoccoides]XP_044452247.1 zinc finger protein ZAT5-like [Triticum aestivum]KAF6998171.1 hypothetical protein CFC21_014314 [Triticum aestivum]KAF6998172.1 hypothetical protein CFC21_014315 [Triticum aestivum]VAH24183.1 unnamed protein product [Triticum turgidum subsp. durum]
MGEDAGDGYGTPPAALAAIVVKGKRSKRRRVHAAAEAEVTAVTTASAAGEVASSSSSVADGGGWRSGADEAASGCVTEEEEDMALCLMLLARGGGGQGSRAGPSSSSSSVVVRDDVAVATAREGKFRSRRPADGGEGEFVYECRTCGKCFPSFQALGGHRTSHKKPRLPLPLPPTTATTASSEEKMKLPPQAAEEKTPPPSPAAAVDRTVLAIPVPATPPKQEATATGVSSKQQGQGRVHECSICGAEFGSGQALGGHMRRHRPLLPASASVSSTDDVAAVLVIRKEKSLLELDLNMPAPCDDAATATSPGSFTFAVKERPSVPAALLPFRAPASALVDCHF